MNPNASNGSSCLNYTEYETTIGGQDIFHVCLQILIFGFGLLGNVILLSIIARNRSLRTTPNLFISNLAVADCVYLLLFVPCDIIGKFGVQLPLFFCKAVYFCRILTVGASVYTLLAMSIDRCLAIIRPMSTLKSSRPNLIPRLGLGAIWILATSLAIPYAVGTHIGTYVHPAGGGTCHVIHSCFPYPSEWGHGYSTGMRVLKLLAYYLLPGLLIALFYSLMAGRLLRSARAPHGQANSSATVQAEGRRKLAKLVLWLALVFFVAWGPDHAATLYFFMAERVSKPFMLFKNFAKILPSAYSASNPVTLCIISKRFRGHFLQVVTCGRRKADEHATTTGAGTQYRSVGYKHRPGGGGGEHSAAAARPMLLAASADVTVQESFHSGGGGCSD